jgi:hypothetical protein
MRQKRPDRVDRRRSLVEMNLISERKKARSSVSRRGCVPFAVLLLAVGSALTAWLGLR